MRSPEPKDLLFLNLLFLPCRKVGLELGAGLDAVKVDVDPRFHVGDADYGPSSKVEFSLTNVRLGVVLLP